MKLVFQDASPPRELGPPIPRETAPVRNQRQQIICNEEVYKSAVYGFRQFLADQLSSLEAQFLNQKTNTVEQHREGGNEACYWDSCAQTFLQGSAGRLQSADPLYTSRSPDQSAMVNEKYNFGDPSSRWYHETLSYRDNLPPQFSKESRFMKRQYNSKISVRSRFTNAEAEDEGGSSPGSTFSPGSMVSPGSMGVGRIGAIRMRQNPFACVELLPCWQEVSSSHLRWNRTPISNMGIQRSDSNISGYWGDCQKSETFVRQFVMHPDSFTRMLWTLISCLIIVYDMVTIPLMAFEMPDSNAMQYISWFTTLWWSADLFLCFFVGYHKDGVVEMRPIEIAKKFFRTWFLLDLLVVLADWIFSVASASRNGINWGKTMRFARTVRLFRLVRMYKMSGALTRIVDSVRSEYWVVRLNIMKLVFFIAVVNHYVACLWYALAAFNDEDHTTWAISHRIEGLSSADKYVASLHWSLTQFTPATNAIGPVNMRERVFAVLIVLFAMVVFSSFVSSITARMTQLRALNRDRIREQAQIREYLGKKRISLNLGHRIWVFSRKHYKSKEAPLHECDIAFFQRLPSALKNELKTEIYQPILQSHHVLKYLVDLNADCSSAICFTLMSELACRPSEEIFSEGEEADRATYVVSGSFLYYHFYQTVKCQHSMWLTELCLWCKWYYAGSMQAETAMELVYLSAGKLGDMIMQRSPNRCRSLKLIRTYARMFVDAASKDQKLGNFLTDLPRDQDSLISMADAALNETKSKVSHRKGGGLLEDHRSPRRHSAMSSNRSNLWSFLRKCAPSDARSSIGTHASSRSAPPPMSESTLANADVGSAEHLDRTREDEGLAGSPGSIAGNVER